jgi:hypothetical protein
MKVKIVSKVQFWAQSLWTSDLSAFGIVAIAYSSDRKKYDLRVDQVRLLQYYVARANHNGCSVTEAADAQTESTLRKCWTWRSARPCPRPHRSICLLRPVAGAVCCGWGVGVGGRRRRGARRPLWWCRSVPIPLATAAPPRLKFENRPASFVCTSRLIDRSMCTPSVPRFRFSRNNFD